jgi:hypothetical protein
MHQSFVVHDKPLARSGLHLFASAVSRYSFAAQLVHCPDVHVAQLLYWQQ